MPPLLSPLLQTLGLEPQAYSRKTATMRISQQPKIKGCHNSSLFNAMPYKSGKKRGLKPEVITL